MICLECGREFERKTVTQKYCSNACGSRYVRRHKSDPEEERARLYPARSFTCACCGYPVAICAGNSMDMRTRFCSGQCERKYWKHPPGRHMPSNNRMTTYRSVEEYMRHERGTNER